jgi:hypothetical protein
MLRLIKHTSVAAGAIMTIGVGAAQVAGVGSAWADNDKLPLYLTRALDATAIKPVSNDMYTGNGNRVTNFMLKRNSDDDIEIAIKAKYRQGFDIRPTYVDDRGRVHVEVPAGPQIVDPAHGVAAANAGRAAWSWDYSISSAIEGATRPLSDFDCTMQIDLDPSKKVNYLTLKLSKLRPPGPFAGETDANGFGWKSGNTIVIGDDAGNPDDAGAPQVQVTQNSQNYAFYRTLIPPFPYNFGPAEFDLEISCDKARSPYTSSRDHDNDRTTVHVVFNVVTTPTP